MQHWGARELIGALDKDAKLKKPAQWDVALEKLAVSGLSKLAMATRKRPGMKDALEKIATRKATSKLWIGKVSEEPLPAEGEGE